MSKAKDRARAQSGIIFRDGKLVNAEEWHKEHPTRAEVQAKVDDAVAKEMAAKFDPVHFNASWGLPYYCTKCGRNHKPDTKIHKAHFNFRKEE